jgi:hypothetical protein
MRADSSRVLRIASACRAAYCCEPLSDVVGWALFCGYSAHWMERSPERHPSSGRDHVVDLEVRLVVGTADVRVERRDAVRRHPRIERVVGRIVALGHGAAEEQLVGVIGRARHRSHVFDRVDGRVLEVEAVADAQVGRVEIACLVDVARRRATGIDVPADERPTDDEARRR